MNEFDKIFKEGGRHEDIKRIEELRPG